MPAQYTKEATTMTRILSLNLVSAVRPIRRKLSGAALVAALAVAVTAPVAAQSGGGQDSVALTAQGNYVCFGKPATILGGAGADFLNGTAGADVIVGLGGDDVIQGFGGDDLICAGEGHDLVRAGDGNDLVGGGPGDDRIRGENGNDRLFGHGGYDRLWGDNGDDVLVGDIGFDDCDGGAHVVGDQAFTCEGVVNVP
jgi:Ca2+-binding RTX toxin-like protein